METPHASPGHSEHQDNSLPPHSQLLGRTFSPTVERSYLLDTTHWTKVLPLILLGICTTFKQDFHCTAAELVYGTTLRLPGEFFHTTSAITTHHHQASSPLESPLNSLSCPLPRTAQLISITFRHVTSAPVPDSFCSSPH